MTNENDNNTDIEKRPEELFDGFDSYEEGVYKETQLIFKEYQRLRKKGKRKKLTPEEKEKRYKLAEEIFMVDGLKRGIWVEKLSRSKYSNSFRLMRLSLVKEYGCRTPFEFMLVDRIVASYWRSMRCDKVFNLLVTKDDDGFHCDQLTVNVIKEINKSIESANRQLNTSIIMLKELKQPKLDVKINTKNAFIGNQQFNVNKQDDQQNEIIEPK